MYLFLRSTKKKFRASPEYHKNHILTTILHRRQFLKTQAEKAFSGTSGKL